MFAFVLLVSACSGGGAPSAEEPSAAAVSTPTPATPEDVLEEFLALWRETDWPGMNSVVLDATTQPGAAYGEVYDELQVTSTSIAVQTLRVDGRRATAEIAVTLGLDRLGEWTYPSTVELVEVGSRWSVEWSPSTVHPALRDGRTFQRLRVWPQRGRLLAWDGVPLRTDLPVVDIGLEPQRIEDREALLPALAGILGLEAETIAAALDAPGVQPDWFVVVTTLRVEEYELVAAADSALSGVVIRPRTNG
ncbi:MAG: NTF2-like N-terminal transpeptidase domain-containing protein, partial [Acidimicrobiales bacterium]